MSTEHIAFLHNPKDFVLKDFYFMNLCLCLDLVAAVKVVNHALNEKGPCICRAETARPL